ncbi:hypothetical protein F01_570063 [Burkholderia cenocepacia]|nr:hypothetical protein F01_570063 [Burkholderia cenocepacia]
MEDDSATFFGHANAERLLRRQKLLRACLASEDTANDPRKQRHQHGHYEAAQNASSTGHRAPRCFHADSVRARPCKTGSASRLQKYNVAPATIPSKHKSKADSANLAAGESKFPTITIINSMQMR